MVTSKVDGRAVEYREGSWYYRDTGRKVRKQRGRNWTKGVLTVLLSLMLVGAMGCTAEQKESFKEATGTFMKFVEENNEKSEEALKVAGDAMARLDEALIKANSNVPVKLPDADDPVVTLTNVGANAAKPFVPYPFNYLLTLIPVIVGWFRTNSQKKKRELEEALLVMSLQKLKKEDRSAFDKVMEYRNMAAQGLLTARQFADLLEGINDVRAKYSVPEMKEAA